MNNTTDRAVDLSVQNSLEFTAYLLTLILGIGGNVLVLIVVIGRHRRRSINDLFIANLATSDLAYILFFLPLKTHARLFGDFPASMAYCKFVYPMMTVTFSVGIVTLTSMAGYRCHFVVHPFKAQLRHRAVLIWMLLIWLFSIAIALPLVIVMQLEDNMCWEMWSESSKKVYTVVLLILQCGLPLIIIIAAYARIAVDLLSSKTARACVNQEGKITTDKGSQENMQVIRTLVVIVVLFVVCMFPPQINWMIFQFGNGQVDYKTMQTLFVVSDILSVIHACMNPIVYGTLTQHFRKGYIKYLSYCLCCYRKRLEKHYMSVTSFQSRSYAYQHKSSQSGGKENQLTLLSTLP